MENELFKLLDSAHGKKQEVLKQLHYFDSYIEYRNKLLAQMKKDDGMPSQALKNIEDGIETENAMKREILMKHSLPLFVKW